MGKHWFKQLLGGVLLLFSLFISVTALGGGKAYASTYQDGTYTIGVTTSPSNATSSSTSQVAFDTSAQAVVRDDVATVTVRTTSSSQPAIKDATVDGKTVQKVDSSSLTFDVKVGTSSTDAVIDFSGNSNAQQDYKLTFDWQNVPSINNSASTQIKSITSPASQMSYQVLKADGKSISEANKYYTHTADVQQLADGSYEITMHVDYSKTSGMTAKGFVPLTVNGVKVSDIQYGSTTKDYTASFKFNVPTLEALTKAPIKGTIHVTVGLVNIDSDFTVYYQFGDHTASQSGNATSDSSKSSSPAKVTLSKSGTKKSSASVKAKLPQTSEHNNLIASLAGLVGLSILIGSMSFRKNHAK